MQPSDARLDLVRGEVRRVLDASPAWRSLGNDERREFARNMVKIGDYLSKDPGWLDAQAPPIASAQMAEAMSAVQDLKERLAQKPGQVGAEFKAGAMRQGVEAFGDLVKTVDFPEFVSGLIQGVFQAIVDASIQQMEAFGELLSATAKSVEQFANDHIGDDQARDQIASRYPSLVRIERNEQGARLVAREGVEDASAFNVLSRDGRSVDLNDPAAEAKLIATTKLEMAQQRQKMMALMVMLGINRIVVTNGRINAKVVFDIKANDKARRRAQAGMDDERQSETGAAAAAWAPWGAGGAYHQSKHKTTVSSSIDDSSESSAQLKAQLSGEVRVNFRSETLPPDKMLEALNFNPAQFGVKPQGQPSAPGQPASSPAPTTSAPAPTAPPAQATTPPPAGAQR